MHRITNWMIASAVALSLPCVALAEEDRNKAFGQGYGLGKDVARLEGEVTQLRALLQQLLELDRQRVSLLEAALAGQPSAAPPATPAPVGRPAARRSRSADTKDASGSIAGKVRTPKRDSVAYVYVENVKGRMVRGKTVQVSQRNKQFSPRFIVIQKGTTIEFPNEDTSYHNVFAKDPAASFDLGIYRAGDQAKSYRFTAPGDVDVYCNMHSGMRSRVLVVPNHLYTKVGSDGAFRLQGVPAGKRKLVAWSPSGEITSTWVEVRGDDTTQASLTVKPRSGKRHTNKHGQPYGSYE